MSNANFLQLSQLMAVFVDDDILDNKEVSKALADAKHNDFTSLELLLGSPWIPMAYYKYIEKIRDIIN